MKIIWSQVLLTQTYTLQLTSKEINESLSRADHRLVIPVTLSMSLTHFFLSNSSNSQLNCKCLYTVGSLLFFAFKIWEGYFSLPFCLYLHFQIVHIQSNHITLKVI